MSGESWSRLEDSVPLTKRHDFLDNLTAPCQEQACQSQKGRDQQLWNQSLQQQIQQEPQPQFYQHSNSALSSYNQTVRHEPWPTKEHLAIDDNRFNFFAPEYARHLSAWTSGEPFHGHYPPGWLSGQDMVYGGPGLEHGAPFSWHGQQSTTPPQPHTVYPWMRISKVTKPKEQSVASSLARSDVKSESPETHPKRQRTMFTSCQIAQLELEYNYNTYICQDRRLALSHNLGLSERQIKVWFQNRRMKDKKSRRPVRTVTSPDTAKDKIVAGDANV